MSITPQDLPNLSAEEKRALLTQLLREKAGKPQTFPLSFAQQRLWFLDQFSKGTSVYNVPFALHIVGDLHVAALRQSLSAIARRHDIMRATFLHENGEPFLKITPAQDDIAMTLIELHALPPTEREAEARRLAAVESHTSFDLATGPLFRTTLIQLDLTEHVLLVTFHHIIFDDWSLRVFLQELATLYAAFTSGDADRTGSPLTKLPIQYTDFAMWERRTLQEEVLHRHLEYWQQLRDAPTLLELPTDRPYPPLRTFRGATHRFDLSPSLTAALRTLSHQSGVTIFMTLLAAFNVLLMRYTGQTHVVVGSPVANRTRTELEELIGLFFNTIVLHTDLSGNPSFRTLLQRVGKVCLGAYAHQEMPFERLVEELQPERDLRHTPLFQVLFDLHVSAPRPVDFPGLTLRWWQHEKDHARFDLSLLMEDTPEKLVGEIIYNTDLFDEATISRMAQHFQVILASAVEQPDRLVNLLPLLTTAEREELLIARNQTTLPYPADQAYHHLFEAQVARTPDAIAVAYGAENLTYHMLEQRANQLARHLQALGVGPEVRVGLCLERSLELLVALLGIFKAGGAFVPLDPGFPPERMAYIIDDAQVKVVVSQAHLRERLPQHLTSLFYIDSNWATVEAQPRTPPSSGVTGANLAYLIYTSGSTGRPKGVLIPHRGLVNYLLWCLVPYTVVHGQGAPVHASIAADAIFPSLFSPLLVGTTVVVLPEIAALDALRETIHNNVRFSMVKITPSQLEVLTHDLTPQNAQGWIQTLVIGAEEVRGEVLRFWQDHAPQTTLLNEYGPTETVVGCSIYVVPPGQMIEGSVPIGLPIANTQFYVLDSSLQPVPLGVPGELFIGGDGVAWGYHGRPDLTAAAFVPDPFSGREGARLYRTGDLVRQLPNPAANIVFLGRIDDQVKIRGYRVEPGEVAEVLRQHESIRDIIVLAQGTGSHTRHLVAYVVPAADLEPDSAALREFLRERVPEYMIPSAFVFLSALPLAPHGKIDRKALPIVDSLRNDAPHTFTSPQDDLERQVAQIWEQVLDIPPIGRHDDFFAIGGHSLLAVRLLSQLKNQFDRDFDLSVLFQNRTIARFTELIRQQTAVLDWSPVVPIQQEGQNLPFFCIHPTGGDPTGYRELARLIGPHQPFYGLKAAPIVELADRDLTIEAMAAQYIAAISIVQPTGPYLLGGWSFGGLVAFEMAQQLHRMGEKVGLVALLDSRPPASLGDATLISDGTLLFVLVKEQAFQLGKTMDLSLAALGDVDPDTQITMVLEAAREIGLDFSTELAWVRRFIRGFRAREQAAYRYQPSVYPGPLVLFKIHEEDTDLIEVHKMTGMNLVNPTYGWEELSMEPLTVEFVPGHHATLLQLPYVQTLADRLRVHLDRSRLQQD